MNISSVGSSDSNLPLYSVRSRSVRQTPSANPETTEAASVQSRSPELTDKLDQLTRVQQAFISALRTGEAIESQGLLATIQ